MSEAWTCTLLVAAYGVAITAYALWAEHRDNLEADQ